MARSRKKKQQRSNKKFRIFVLWGSGTRQHIRRLETKNYKDYFKVGKYGRYNLYVRKGKSWNFSERLIEKTKNKIKQLVAPEKTKREEALDKIRGISRITETEKQLERRLLVNPGKYKRVSKKFIAGKINPQGRVMTDGKIYKNFAEMEMNKFDIYKNIILKNIKNEKLVKSIYANRRQILRDGMIIKMKLFGDVNSKVKGIRYLGTLEFTGLMLEEVKAIEDYVIGFSGYLEDLGREAYHMAQSKGGKTAKITENNAIGTNAQVKSIQLEFNYA